MHTQERFFELTKNKYENVGNAVEPMPLSYEFSVPQLARIQALSERLDVCQEELIKELLDGALGDAHEGFLRAFPEGREKEDEDRRLKCRVKSILDLTTVENQAS